MLQYFRLIFIKNFSQCNKVVFVYTWFTRREKEKKRVFNTYARFLQECDLWKSLELFHNVQAYNDFLYAKSFNVRFW